MKVIKASNGGDNDEDYENFINSSDFKTTLSCFGGSKSEKMKKCWTRQVCLKEMMDCVELEDEQQDYLEIWVLDSDSNYEVRKNAIIEALSDVKDFETRRAASGCLPILSTNQDVCKMILKRPRDLLILKDLLDEQSVELQHRSVECLKNIASTNK
nr:349_t:CDS:2 [Entrophospora candida]